MSGERRKKEGSSLEVARLLRVGSALARPKKPPAGRKQPAREKTPPPAAGEPEFIAALDLGTKSIRCLIGELKGASESNEDGDVVADLRVIGVGSSGSFGVRKGAVVDLARVADAVEIAVEEAAGQARVAVEALFVGLSGEHLRGVNTRGCVAITAEAGTVSRRHLEAVLRRAGSLILPPDREVLHVLPQKFAVDDLGELDSPLGLAGARLEVQTHVVTADKAHLTNACRAVERAGYGVEGIVLKALASARAVLSADERRLGTTLVDLGAGTSDVIVFSGGVVRASAVLPVGGDHLTNDVAVAFKLAPEVAEKLRCAHGTAKRALLSETEEGREIEVPAIDGERRRAVSLGQLAQVLEDRVEELFCLLAETLEREGSAPSLEAGVILTGGLAQMPGVVEKAREVFQTPARLGLPKLHWAAQGSQPDPALATAAGLLVIGAQMRQERLAEKKVRFTRRLWGGMKRLAAAF